MRANTSRVWNSVKSSPWMLEGPQSIKRTNVSIEWLFSGLRICRSYASKARLGHFWTEEEISRLTQLKHQHKSKEEILSNLPGRTWDSITSKWHLIGERDEETGELVHRTGCRRFTSEEKQTILELKEAGLSFVEIAKRLPGRTPGQVSDYWKRYLTPNKRDIKPTKKYVNWTEVEVKRVAKMREKQGMLWSEIAGALGRSVQAVKRAYDNRNPNPKPLQYKSYTAEEDATLIRMYDEGATQAEIQRALPHRTINSINLRKAAIRHRLQKDKHQATDVELARIRPRIFRMREEEGKPWAEISEQFPQYAYSTLRAMYSRSRRRLTEGAKKDLENEVEKDKGKPKLQRSKKRKAKTAKAAP